MAKTSQKYKKSTVKPALGWKKCRCQMWGLIKGAEIIISFCLSAELCIQQHQILNAAVHLEMFCSEALETLYSTMSSINMLTNPPEPSCVCFNQPTKYTVETDQHESVQIFHPLSLIWFISWCPDAREPLG